MEDERRYQTDIVKKEIFDLIDEKAGQYKITYAEMIGILESVKLALWYENTFEEE